MENLNVRSIVERRNCHILNSSFFSMEFSQKTNCAVIFTCEVEDAAVAGMDLSDGQVRQRDADLLQSQLHGVGTGRVQQGLIHRQRIDLPRI